MAAENGHSPNRSYMDQDGAFHLNGAAFFNDAETDISGSLEVLDDLAPAELQVLEGMPANITMSYAAGASTISEVTMTVVDAAGSTIAGVFQFDIWLSDASTGAGLTGTTASGTVTAKAASGTVIDTQVSKKALRVQTLATGVFILEITDSAKTAFYPCAQLPSTGVTVVGDVMATGDYGA